MSKFAVEVFVVRETKPLPNSDTLTITEALGYPVIFKTGDFKTGDLAVYVPVDALVPMSDPKFSFLDSGKGRSHERVKAKRLRGTYSEGLIVPAPAGFVPGDNVADQFGIVKYEEPEEQTEAAPEQKGSFWRRLKHRFLVLVGLRKAPPPPDNMKDPGVFPHYDLEPLRKYQSAFTEGEHVILTEKIHGCNARYGWHKGKFYVGSHNRFKNPAKSNVWTRVAQQFDLAAKLKTNENLFVFGEIYGEVQDLKYGAAPGELKFRVFDMYDLDAKRWYDQGEIEILAGALGLDTVPVIYQGPWKGLAAHAPLAEEDSALVKKQIREGWVARPVEERHVERVGRCVFKYVGQRYQLRKNGTEKH